MVNKKWFLIFLFAFIITGFIACKKSKTVTVDYWLIENPGDKKVKYVANGKIKRGEYLKTLEERLVDGKKFFKVQVEGVETSGWIAEPFVKDGKLNSVTVTKDSDLYMRPSLKSDKVGTVKAGQVAFRINIKDDFVLIQYPGIEAYILKTNVGEGSFIIKQIAIPGIGTATINASSQFSSGEGKELEFDPRNLFDGSLQTAWCEGVQGDGIGESVTVQFPQYVRLSSVSLVNGWTKGEEYYQQNTRVAQIRIRSDNGQEAVVDFDDNVLDYQRRDISITGVNFQFIINKTHKGKDPDTCISEIKLEGAPVSSPYQPYGGGN